MTGVRNSRNGNGHTKQTIKQSMPTLTNGVSPDQRSEVLVVLKARLLRLCSHFPINIMTDSVDPFF